MRTDEINNTEDIISVNNITDRVDELRERREDDDLKHDSVEWAENLSECATLEGLLADMRGSGGDHEWRGHWYPGSMIRDSYFTDYARELAEDIGAIQSDAHWPATCIDWDEAADQLKQDYSAVEFDGVMYWAR